MSRLLLKTSGRKTNFHKSYINNIQYNNPLFGIKHCTGLFVPAASLIQCFVRNPILSLGGTRNFMKGAQGSPFRSDMIVSPIKSLPGRREKVKLFRLAGKDYGIYYDYFWCVCVKMGGIEGLRHVVLGTNIDEVPERHKVAVFANGCFWGSEKGIWRLPVRLFCVCVRLFIF
jgi:hypothetical protein